MKYRENGTVICSRADLMVLRHAAERGLAWGDAAMYQKATPDALPIIPCVQVLVLLAFHPQSYGSYLHFLYRTMEISNDSGAFYFERTLSTSPVKLRRIATPLPLLMALQRWLLREIIDHMAVSPASFAYRRGFSLADNAAPHIGKRQMVKLDISHFFESVSYGKVYGIFAEAGYSEQVSTLLAKLCTLRGHLPQGAPTSPSLANLALRRFDDIMLTYCKNRGIVYTRYSDDLTFSADQMDTSSLIRFARETLRAEGFSMNTRKVRVLGIGAQHRVCGIVVNNRLSVPKDYRRKLRQEMYFLQKSTLDDHIRRLNDPKFLENDGGTRRLYYLRNLLGRLHHAYRFNPTTEFLGYIAATNALLDDMTDREDTK